jgi:hypothetical protein
MKKKNPQTKAALALLAKLAEIGPPPELAVRPTPESIMEEKRDKALQLWALRKMGRDREKYIAQAERIFLALLYLTVTVAKKDFITALKETPYALPLKPTEKQPFPFDLLQFKKEYDQLHPKVHDAKNKTRHNPVAQKMALAEALGITNKKTIEKYLEMKASDIVLDHLRSKHGWTIDIEMIQKNLSLVRHPKKIVEYFAKTFARQAGLKLA